MGTITIRFTTEEAVRRWEKLEAQGKLGPKQKERLDEYRRTNGNPSNNQLGRMILDNEREKIRNEQ